MIEEYLIRIAKKIRKSFGGSIFAFPIDIEDQFSKYAVVVNLHGKYFVFPEASDVSEAAEGVITVLEELRKAGYELDFDRDVRFIVGENQLNAPDVRMRRLKRYLEEEEKSTP